MAGGKSSRMGTDKAFVPLLGKPLVEHVLDHVHGLGSETIIMTNKTDDYSYLGLALHRDIYPDRGPLGGLHAALKQAKHPYLLVVACDMPWLNRPLLNYLVGLRYSADVIVPRWHDYPEPLHAVYNRSCLESIEDKIQRGQLKTISFYETVTVRYVERSEIIPLDPNGRSFSNINTPDELTRAENSADFSDRSYKS